MDVTCQTVRRVSLTGVLIVLFASLGTGFIQPVFLIDVTISNDTATFNNISIINASLSTADDGSYELVLADADRERLYWTNISGQEVVWEFGEEPRTQSTVRSYVRIPYIPEAAHIQIQRSGTLITETRLTKHLCGETASCSDYCTQHRPNPACAQPSEDQLFPLWMVIVIAVTLIGISAIIYFSVTPGE